jgi:hypothetical protein
VSHSVDGVVSFRQTANASANDIFEKTHIFLFHCDRGGRESDVDGHCPLHDMPSLIFSRRNEPLVIVDDAQRESNFLVLRHDYTSPVFFAAPLRRSGLELWHIRHNDDFCGFCPQGREASAGHYDNVFG